MQRKLGSMAQEIPSSLEPNEMEQRLLQSEVCPGQNEPGALSPVGTLPAPTGFSSPLPPTC